MTPGTCGNGPSTRPCRGRYKIYIIDEAHMVTREGFNALLKLVEEPPPHLKFVFATTEPEKVIATIRSRTHHYPFRLVPPAVLREHLEQILASEGVPYEPVGAADRHPGRRRIGPGRAVGARPARRRLGRERPALRPGHRAARLHRRPAARRGRRGVRRRRRRGGLPRHRPRGGSRARSAPVRRRPARPAARPDRHLGRAGRGRRAGSSTPRPDRLERWASRPPRSAGRD